MHLCIYFQDSKLQRRKIEKWQEPHRFSRAAADGSVITDWLSRSEKDKPCSANGEIQNPAHITESTDSAGAGSTGTSGSRWRRWNKSSRVKASWEVRHWILFHPHRPWLLGTSPLPSGQNLSRSEPCCRTGCILSAESSEPLSLLTPWLLDFIL